MIFSKFIHSPPSPPLPLSPPRIAAALCVCVQEKGQRPNNKQVSR
jgi:hypothetical protein